MSLFNFLATKVGPDVANLILDYKSQLEHVEKFKKVLCKIPDVIRITAVVHGMFEDIVGEYYLEKEAFIDLMEELDLDTNAICGGAFIEVDQSTGSLQMRNLCMYHPAQLESVVERENLLPQYDPLLNLQLSKRMLKYLKCPTWKRPGFPFPLL